MATTSLVPFFQHFTTCIVGRKQRKRVAMVISSPGKKMFDCTQSSSLPARRYHGQGTRGLRIDCSESTRPRAELAGNHHRPTRNLEEQRQPPLAGRAHGLALACEKQSWLQRSFPRIHQINRIENIHPNDWPLSLFPSQLIFFFFFFMFCVCSSHLTCTSFTVSCLRFTPPCRCCCCC